MNQIERITAMEKHLNSALETVENLDRALEEFIKVKPDIEELLNYYGSPTWFKDVEDDDQGRIPQDLNRGVLSEDGIWNMLYDYNLLQEKLLLLSETIKK